VEFPALKRSDVPSLNRVARRIALGLLTAVVLLAVVGSLSETLSERWWAHEVGFGGSFDYRLRVSIGVWIVALVLSASALFTTVRRVERVARGVIAGHQPVDPSIRWPLIVAGTLMVAPILGGRWMAVMLAWHGWSQPMPGPPLLGPDPGFYVFRLPLLQAITSWFTAVSAVSVVMTVAVLMLTGLISRREGRLQGANPGVARLVAIPLACFCVGISAAMWWSRFGMASRRNGRFVGLYSVDYSVRLPGLSLLGLGALAVAATLLLSVRRRSGAIGVMRSMSPIDMWDEFVLPRIGVVLWLVTAVMTLAILPGVVQSQPLTGASQQNNLARHIEATLVAYDLGELDIPKAISKSTFDSTDVRNQATDLERSSVAMTTVAAKADEWIIGARSPSRGAVDVNEYATAKRADDTLRGMSLRSRWHRVVLAVRFGSVSLLKSDKAADTVLHHTEVRDRARAVAPFLLFDAEPYAVTDLSGRDLWVLDGYTAATKFPGAQRVALADAGLGQDSDLARGVNFVRASVKVIVDARTGDVRLYRTGTSDQVGADPIGDVWARAFPRMFRSAKSLNDDYPGLGAQLRYPHDLFRVQTSLIGRYHSRDNEQLVTGSEQWTPADLSATESLGAASIYQPYAVKSDSGRPLGGRLSAIRVMQQQLPGTDLSAGPSSGSASATASGAASVSSSDPLSESVGRATAVVVGRSSPQGRNTLIVERVTGPIARLTKQRVASSSVVNAARIAAKVDKARLEFGPLQPLPIGSLMVFVQTVYARPAVGGQPRTVLGIVATEGDRIEFGASANLAVSKLLDALAQPATTIAPPAPSLKALQQSLAESERRLNESERVISSLQERISKLESASSISTTVAP
jgi:uncharacterized membrane protein (UPF0182 family)